MGFKLFLSSEVIKCIQFRQLLRSSPEKHCIVKILMSGVSSAGAMRLIKVSQSRCQALHVLSFSALTCHIDFSFHHLKTNIFLCMHIVGPLG